MESKNFKIKIMEKLVLTADMQCELDEQIEKIENRLLPNQKMITEYKVMANIVIIETN